MKNSSYTSTKTASKPMNDLADTMNSSSRISTTSLRIEDLNCQPFFMRGYVAQMRDTTPRACIPFDGISEDTWNQQRGSLDVPRHRWWRRCKPCVHEAAPSSVAIDERLNELSDTIKSLSIDSTTSDELKNENLNCRQPFSMRYSFCSLAHVICI
ncbi:hypothetical protein POM88_033856 [Heracleum sosnowskyi]|uniref:Uncharacterized protein n=1 Tax=Heracleum sosnowskyi TaxID=360622 RepID=A0AAD8HII7_9APIA|nr:hypothetical protein POM88_033856 [Heracleum sosnowskyi]